MQETLAQILLILRGAWRFRWAGVALAWAIAVGGWIYVQTLPDTYEASTNVYVDTDSLLKPLLAGLAVSQDVMGQVSMMQAVMLSRPNLEKVAQKTDLFLNATTPEQQQAIVDSLAARVELGRSRGRGRSSSFIVAFSDKDPEVAFNVVQTLLDTFMEDSLGLKRSDSDVAQRFLDSQIADYERKLIEAEERLAQFKQQNVALLPGQSGDFYSRLQSEIGLLNGMKAQLQQLTERRNELARQLEGEEPTYGLTGTGEGSPIDVQIARLRASRDQILLSYTEKHPQVIVLNETIARLEEEKRQGAKISGAVAPPGAENAAEQMLVRSLDMNPVYQNLRLTLSEADANLAELRGRISAQEATVAGLQARVNSIPEIEAELTRLDRDYNVNRGQYEKLLQRRESARISEQAEQNTENVKFRIINPPVVPIQPSGPDRGKMNTAVFLLALAAGLGLAVLLSQLRPTFVTRDILQKVTGLRVLGAVSAAIQSGLVPWYRRQVVTFGGAVSLLGILYLLNSTYSGLLREALRNLSG